MLYTCHHEFDVFVAFRFEVMADYQYLVPDLPDFLKEVKDADPLTQDIPLHVPPPVFSRFDHPSDYNYRPEPQTGKGGSEKGHNLDEERYKHPIFVQHMSILNIFVCKTTVDLPMTQTLKGNEK